MTPPFPPDTLLQRRALGRPFPIVLPPLHERVHQSLEIDGHGRRAGLEDDLGVDLWVHVGGYLAPDRVVGEEGRRDGDEDFDGGDYGVGGAFGC